MYRRSALSRLAATLTGLPFVGLPSLDALAPLSDEPFSVTRANLAESSGTVTCPLCHEMWDSLELTPAGLCLRCADGDPAIRVNPHSDPFWILSPREIRRLETEIQRLAAELERMDDRLVGLQRRQMAGRGGGYDRAVEAARDDWHALQRELHLLHLLRAASRQFGS
jgi:hypothetical protein